MLYIDHIEGIVDHFSLDNHLRILTLHRELHSDIVEVPSICGSFLGLWSGLNSTLYSERISILLPNQSLEWTELARLLLSVLVWILYQTGTLQTRRYAVSSHVTCRFYRRNLKMVLVLNLLLLHLIRMIDLAVTQTVSCFTRVSFLPTVLHIRRDYIDKFLLYLHLILTII